MSAILVAAQVLCSAAFMAATNGQSMPSYAKPSMSGSGYMKPKGGRFPDQHLFARSKRLSDFIVEGMQCLLICVAINRFTGQVIDNQIEVVNEYKFRTPQTSAPAGSCRMLGRDLVSRSVDVLGT